MEPSALKQGLNRHTCVYVPYRQVRGESYPSTTSVDLALPVVRIGYCFHHVAATYNSTVQTTRVKQHIDRARFHVQPKIDFGELPTAL